MSSNPERGHLWYNGGNTGRGDWGIERAYGTYPISYYDEMGSYQSQGPLLLKCGINICDVWRAAVDGACLRDKDIVPGVTRVLACLRYWDNRTPKIIQRPCSRDFVRSTS